jgi:predicted MFS family arabinose efflux permease
MNTTTLEQDALKKENLIIYILGAIQFVHILDFVILMPLGPMLMRTFQVSPSQFGMLVSSYTFAAGIANFLASIVADRFERKRMLQVCFAGFLVGTLLCALAPNFEMLLAARIFAGAFGGVLNAVVFALVPDIIPPQRRGTANGVIMSAFSVSSVIGVPIGLALAEWFDWHAPFIFIVVIGLLIWWLSAIIIP